MDCTNARLLLNFVRTGELDLAEREVLETNSRQLPECAARQAESHVDDALETAMQRCPVLGRLLKRAYPSNWPANAGRVPARWAGQRQLP